MNDLAAYELAIPKEMKVRCDQSNRSLYIAENHGRLEIVGEACIVKIARNSPTGEVLIFGSKNFVEVRENLGIVAENEDELGSTSSKRLSGILANSNSNHIFAHSQPAKIGGFGFQMHANPPLVSYAENHQPKGSVRQNKIKLGQPLLAAVPPSYKELSPEELVKSPRY